MSSRDDMQLLRPEVMFHDSFRVGSKLKRHVQQCIISALVGFALGAVAGFSIR